MYRAGFIVLPLGFALLSATACDPITAPSSDGAPAAQVDADPSAPDAAVNPALCGNNQPDPGETCDDGNKNSGDGCSEACLNESVFCDPKQQGSLYSIGSSAGRMVADGNYLYVTGHPTTLNPVFRVLDVTNPSSVGEASFFNHSAMDYPTSRVRTLLKRGNLVWLSGNDPGLTSIDVSDPGNAKLGMLKLNPETDGHLARIGENFMLVSQSISERPVVYDITTSNPVSQGVLGDPGDVYYSVGSSTTHGFASTYSKAVDIYSGTETPATATVVGRYEHATPWNSGTAVREILADGNLLLLAMTGTASGIHVIDVGIPSAPVWKATIPETPQDIALVGKYVYVPRSDGIRVYDLSDAANPTLAGSIVDFNFNATSIAVDGNRAYAISEDKLMIVEGLPGICQPICGNNTKEYSEACDDGNRVDGDACSADCSSEN